MDVSRPRIPARARRLSLRQSLSAGWERALWRRRTVRWEEQSSHGLTTVVAAVLERCDAGPDTVAVDLGCGSGQVTLPLAARCASVLAVDVNAYAVQMLRDKAQAAGITNVQTLATPIQGLELDPAGVDLVVTNYTLHHLGDADKRALLADAIGWLRPGGRLVIGDMMFGRGSTAGDRTIIAAKLRAMVVRGPAGWWRIVKNVWRFSLRVQEKPLPVAAWERLVTAAGFTAVRTERIVQEACVLSALRPPLAGQPAQPRAAGQPAEQPAAGEPAPA